jgi:hypothetical protein
MSIVGFCIFYTVYRSYRTRGAHKANPSNEIIVKALGSNSVDYGRLAMHTKLARFGIYLSGAQEKRPLLGAPKVPAIEDNSDKVAMLPKGKDNK